MFDKLVELLVQFLDCFYVWNVVQEWERGVVLRFGRPVRDVGPGLHWLWPLHIERILVEDTYERPAQLQVQSLTTSDGVSVALSALVVFKVANVRRVLLKSGGHEDAILSTIPAVVADHVTRAAYRDLMEDEFLETVTAAARAEARRWGIKVLSVRWANLARARTIRLLQEQSHA